MKVGAQTVWRCKNQSCCSEILVKQISQVDIGGSLYCSICGAPMKKVDVDLSVTLKLSADDGLLRFHATADIPRPSHACVACESTVLFLVNSDFTY
jgi:hypothetical protein